MPKHIDLEIFYFNRLLPPKLLSTNVALKHQTPSASIKHQNHLTIDNFKKETKKPNNQKYNF